MSLSTKYDYRFDPFTEEDQAIDIAAEGVDVPANTPYYITLEEVPRQDSPTSVVVYDVTAGATLSEVSAGPATGEYQVDYKYKTGKIRFNSAQASHHAHVTYKGTGHCIRAKWVNDIQELTGTVKMFAGLASAIQEGYLLCNGAAISRTTYAALFTKLSTRYGIGDNSTTFNLPNLVSKFVRGVADNPGTGAGADTHSHTLAEVNLPAHTHAAGTLTGGAHTHALERTYGHGGAVNSWVQGSDDAANKFFPAYTTDYQDGWENIPKSPGSVRAASGGAVAVTGATGTIGSGTAFTADNVPAYTQMLFIIKT